MGTQITLNYLGFSQSLDWDIYIGVSTNPVRLAIQFDHRNTFVIRRFPVCRFVAVFINSCVIIVNKILVPV